MPTFREATARTVEGSRPLGATPSTPLRGCKRSISMRSRHSPICGSIRSSARTCSARCSPSGPSAARPLGGPGSVSARSWSGARRRHSLTSTWRARSSEETAAPDACAGAGQERRATPRLPPSPMRFVPVLPPRPPRGRGVQRQRPARGAAPRSSKSSAVHGHARNAAQTPSIAPPPGTARARPPIHPTHSGDSPSDNDTHPARPRPPRRGPRRRNHTAQRARVRRRHRPTPRAVLLPAPRGLRRLPRRLERRARARGARVCALGAPPGWTCARSSSSGQSPRVRWNERARPPERCPRHRAGRARARPMSAPLVRLRTDTRPTFTETEDVEPRASPAPAASPAAATDRGATQTPWSGQRTENAAYETANTNTVHGGCRRGVCAVHDNRHRPCERPRDAQAPRRARAHRR